jgi:Aspartyl protease
MTTVTYLSCSPSHSFVANPPGAPPGQLVDRPWVEVVVHWGGSQHRLWCLVDTGADDTMLDLGTAAVLGINHLALPPVPVRGVTGQRTQFRVQSGVRLDFGGASVPAADVLFGPVALPLLGRSALLDAASGVEVGFDTGAWYHT